MTAQIERACKHCPTCQRSKGRKRKYGHLPAKDAVVEPWNTLHCDLIGPITLKAEDGTEIDFMCLTMIDAATGWFEIVELPNKWKEEKNRTTGKIEEVEIIDKDSATVSHLLNKCWFSRYPRPQYLVCDNGSKFKLHLDYLCKQYSVKRKPTTSKTASKCNY